MKTLREQIREAVVSDWKSLKLDLGLECARLALEAAKAKKQEAQYGGSEILTLRYVDIGDIDALLEELNDEDTA